MTTNDVAAPENRDDDKTTRDDDLPRWIGIESVLFEAFINRWKILEDRPCRIRMRHGDGGEEERKVAISVRQMHRGCGCEKRNELLS